MLPTFLIVGAGRSGTTTLAHYCAAHPDIFMCHIKEPNYFTFGAGGYAARGPGGQRRARSAIKSDSAYHKLFASAKNEAARGEASVSYFWRPEACQAIHGSLPGVQIVIILRHPVDRAFSSYCKLRRDGIETAESFEAAWRDQPRRMAEDWYFGQYKRVGQYADHLSRYFARFSRRQIAVFLFSDLQNDPAGLCAALYDHIGVDAGFRPELTTRRNASGEIENPVLRAVWYRTAGLRDRLSPFVPLALRGRLFKAVASQRIKSGSKEELSEPVRCAITAEFRDDILRTQDLIDRDLSDWLA